MNIEDCYYEARASLCVAVLDFTQLTTRGNQIKGFVVNRRDEGRTVHRCVSSTEPPEGYRWGTYHIKDLPLSLVSLKTDAKWRESKGGADHG